MAPLTSSPKGLVPKQSRALLRSLEGAFSATGLFGVIFLSLPAFGQEVHPAVGPAPLVSTPLSQVTAGNKEWFIVTPSLSTVYDSNPLRADAVDLEIRDNVRITPGVDLRLNRLIGRTRLGLAGTVGYDYNTRFSFLDQIRVDLSGSALLRVGSPCPIALSADYNRSLIDLEDSALNPGSTRNVQDYDLGVVCTGIGLLAPEMGASYRRFSTGGDAQTSSETTSGRIGLRYSRPSLGTVVARLNYAQIRRAQEVRSLDRPASTDVYNLSLHFERDVSPRLGASMGVGYYRAKTADEGYGNSSGPSFDARIRWQPVPRLALTLLAKRELTNSELVGAAYQRADVFSSSTSLQVTAKTQLTASYTWQKRNFEGIDPLYVDTLSKDETTAVSLALRHELARNIRTTLRVSRRNRNRPGEIFDYTSSIIGLSVGARF